MYEQQTTVGTCGLCGGKVSVPTVWMSVIPPTPICEDCGATAKVNHGPTLPMNPPQKIFYTNYTSECCAQ